HRGNQFEVKGGGKAIRQAQALLVNLYKEAGRQSLTPKKIQLFLQESGLELLLKDHENEQITETQNAIKLRNKTIKARGENQCQYLKNIQRNDINFGIGPAGTGKTYLAVAMAVKALEDDKVRRLILARPAVEAGERLGFLPGDLSQKIDPYLRPLYDALYEMLGFDHVSRLIEKNIIEVAPLAFMRGRTLNEACVLLDEAQNTTKEQMKMFLTRLGFASKAIITGDLTQTDLPSKQHSGLFQAVTILEKTEGVSFTFFNKKDVVRHPLVQRVVAAYEKHEK
ncbi:MAG TPA: PhoH family protein, partial [Gammaproteobacteria bacterium]|nr:PhoH family protein [Gammaproteobacteria bacterium]